MLEIAFTDRFAQAADAGRRYGDPVSAPAHPGAQPFRPGLLAVNHADHAGGPETRHIRQPVTQGPTDRHREGNGAGRARHVHGGGFGRCPAARMRLRLRAEAAGSFRHQNDGTGAWPGLRIANNSQSYAGRPRQGPAAVSRFPKGNGSQGIPDCPKSRAMADDILPFSSAFPEATEADWLREV